MFIVLVVVVVVLLCFIMLVLRCHIATAAFQLYCTAAAAIPAKR